MKLYLTDSYEIIEWANEPLALCTRPITRKDAARLIESRPAHQAFTKADWAKEVADAFGLRHRAGTSAVRVGSGDTVIVARETPAGDAFTLIEVAI